MTVSWLHLPAAGMRWYIQCRFAAVSRCRTSIQGTTGLDTRLVLLLCRCCVCLSLLARVNAVVTWFTFNVQCFGRLGEVMKLMMMIRMYRKMGNEEETDTMH